MKKPPAKILIVISVILLLSSCNFLTERRVSTESEYYYYSWNKKKIYFKSTSIYHTYLPIPTGTERYDMNADAATFKVLTDVVAKDKDYVYCWAAKTDYIDAPSFYYFTEDLYKDKDHVYLYDSHRLNIMEDADPETFEYFQYPEYYKSPRGLAKDKNGYFLNYKRISVDTATFEVLGDFAHGGFDKDSIYALTYPMKAYPLHGRLIRANDKLLYDDNNVYHFTWQGRNTFSRIAIRERGSFVLYSSDKNTIFKVNDTLYWNNYVIQEMDLASFQYVDGSFAKDRNGVYIVRNIQKGNVHELSYADPETFRGIDENLAYDKTNVYYGSRIVPDADPNTIRVDGQLLKDKNHEWQFDRESQTWQKVTGK